MVVNLLTIQPPYPGVKLMNFNLYVYCGRGKYFLVIHDQSVTSENY